MKLEDMKKLICHRSMANIDTRRCIGTDCIACRSYGNKYKPEEYYCLDLKEEI